MTASISSSFTILSSPPSIRILEPAYLVISTQSVALHQAPFGNLSLSLYASGPTFKTRQTFVVICASATVSSVRCKPALVFFSSNKGNKIILKPVGSGTFPISFLIAGFLVGMLHKVFPFLAYDQQDY